MKRFQECNKLEQLFRYRWYLLIPLKFGFRQLKPFKIYEDKIVNNKLVHTDNFKIPKGKLLWRLLIGEAQGKMKWYYTGEEVKARIKTE